jgi:hypothetical protein
MPRPSTSSERLTPRLPRSVGLRPVFFPTQRGFAHRPVERQPAPIDAGQFVIDQQTGTPERLEHPGRCPLLEAPMRRGGGAQGRLVQRIPLAAGAQHKEDGVHRRAVRHPRVMAAQRVVWPRWQQWFHLRPQFVRQPPAIIADRLSRLLPILLLHPL